MNRVGQVNDYEQWAADANRGQDERLTTTAASRTHAAQAQRLSDAQVDNDRHHTYYYVPRSDDRGAAYYYYPWSRGGSRDSWDWYDSYPRNNPRHYNHTWYGRTHNEVLADYYSYAMRHHLGRAPRAGDQEWVPRNPRDDQMFWVKEVDGGWTQRANNTIENDLRPGYWSEYRGKPIFIRTRD
ncbi:hypothetical protein GTA08_BOTSDO01372 [Botryosphaeria dothidea]|uniref:Uncharacterized protein n=1 Tax=Botryosphaeria dothidea TaxID=55169 RepID=A0A8H4NBI5_9PEZI|nr:hypothetical protein GTA08_BOTSDO01372 [Botryosphaeria dothidea]